MSEIDVSKCEFYCEKYDGCYCFNSSEEAYGVDPDAHHSCGANTNCYYKQLQQLKAENERLKELLSDKPIETVDIDSSFEIIKLRNCLDEIEEIANDDSFPSDFDVYEERDFYFNQLCKIDEILQKIKQAKEGGE